MKSRPVPSPEVAPPAGPRLRLGLALAGGAARGGYHVGVLDALVEHDIRIEGIAGTSIGALNSVVLAAAPTLAEGARDLDALWTEFTAAVGEVPGREVLGDRPARQDDGNLTDLGALLPRLSGLLSNRGLLEEMVHRVMERFFAVDALPVWVAAYPVFPAVREPGGQALLHALDWLRGRLGDRSRILHLNRMAPDDAEQAVLASAALPLLFKSREVGGTHFRDGMLGGDNLPIRALARSGFDAVIAVHLRPGGLLRAAEHPDLVTLEIRPSTPLGKAGALVDFSPSRYRTLRQQGYWDACQVMTRLRGLLETQRAADLAHRNMIVDVSALDAPLEGGEAQAPG